MDDQSKTAGATLHTAIILTRNLLAMADFYQQGLALDAPLPHGGNHLGFALPNAYFGFDRVEEPPPPNGVVSLWFAVDDLEATFTRFQALGARVKYGPTRKPWGAHLAALYDPDGNLFGLTQHG